MEVFTQTWVVFMIYCTQLFDFKQCFAVPIPTLINYYSNGSPQNVYYPYKYRQTRDPEIFQDSKFVFPDKKRVQPNLNRRNGFYSNNRKRFDTGKIYFPDEISSLASSKEKIYESPNSKARPSWNTQRRPSSAITNSHSKWTNMDPTRSSATFPDGSSQNDHHHHYNKPEPNENISSGSNNCSVGSSSSSGKESEEEKVAAAIQEFYKWLQQSKAKAKPTDLPRPQMILSSNDRSPQTTTKPNSSSSENETTDYNFALSEQSIVSALQEKPCPEGQIRVGTNCKTKVDV